MSFVGILLALLAERALGRAPGWGEPAVFPAMVAALQRWLDLPALWRSAIAPLLLIAPPVVLVAWLRSELVHPFVELTYSSAVLLLCLGPRDLADDVHALLRARAASDTAEVERLSRALMRGPEPEPTARTLFGALFIQSHERLFGVLIWFFVCGPAGALAYRLARTLPRTLRETQREATPAVHMAESIHGLLAWVPARATALLYGLGGSLDDALVEWRALENVPHEWHSHTWAILAQVPSASLSQEEADGSVAVPASLDANLGEVLRMQWRALLILLAFFAFFTTGAML
ncbi:MAG TPA: regulatory signaling modulator protein AmpE [Nevskiaceae bacterium]|nr:regulatory signaling modulator protein AmpE [Nevskiaceae bacterium]